MKIVQIAVGEIPPLQQRCMAACKALAERDGHKYTVYTDLGVHASHGSVVDGSDLLRLDLASSTPDMVYVDWDIEPRTFGYAADVPLFGHAGSRPSTCFIRVNGRTDVMARLFDIARKWRRNTAEKTLWRLQNEIEFQQIPRRDYTHYHNRGSRKYERAEGD